MGDWFAIYQTTNGQLISLATIVADPLPTGLDKKLIAPYPGATHQWNPILLDWELAPPRPPDVDRIDEFVGRIGMPLKNPVLRALRNELAVILAEQRFRDPSESYEIGVT